jgi:hypothetical protein
VGGGEWEAGEILMTHDDIRVEYVVARQESEVFASPHSYDTLGDAKYNCVAEHDRIYRMVTIIDEVVL